MKISSLYKGMAVFFVLICIVLAVYYLRNPLGPKLQIRDQVFTVELAVTPQEHLQGLSGRDQLPDNHGLLFVYRDKSDYQFWMKDMKFALDFIWIEDTTVVDLTKNVPPPGTTGDTKVVHPKARVNRVLEVNAGTIDRVGIQIGDTVQYLRK